MEYRRIGVMEYWNDGVMGPENTITPILQHSNTPFFF